jgi:hypothetical protein
VLWPLFGSSAWARPDTVVAGTTGKGASLACVGSVGVGSASDCGGEHGRWGRGSGFCSIGRLGLKQPLCWLARQVGALLWLLLARSALAYPATVVVVTIVEGSALASVPFVGVGPAIYCGSWHDK